MSNEMKFISSIANQVQPQINYITDYFERENIDGKLGELSLIWLISMSVAVRSKSLNDVEETLETSVNLIKDVARMFFILKDKMENK